MRSLTVIGLVLFSSLSGTAQNPDDPLQKELEAIHAKWFRAFRTADAATMNQLETTNILLVMPDGSVLKDFGPRKQGELKAQLEVKDSLKSISVRRFLETAVLVGILMSESPKETSRVTETVIFVRNAGQWKIASAQWTSVSSGGP